MAKAFRRRGNRVVATLDDLEREVVSVLMAQTRDLLAPAEGLGLRPDTSAVEPAGDAFDELMASTGISDGDEAETLAGQGPSSESGPSDRPGARDAALDRLLPSANRSDPEAAAEFRRLTEHGLRLRKTANLTVAIEALAGAVKDRVRLDHEQAQAFVVALVDVRLLLGERLGLHTDQDADALHGELSHGRPDDPRTLLAAYYDFLTWLQESLTQALMR